MRNLEAYILIFSYLDIKTLASISLVCRDWHRAVNVCKSLFRDIQYILPGYEITPIQRRLLYNSLPYLAGHNRWIVKVLSLLDWSRQEEVLEAERLLKSPRNCRCWNLMCTRFCQRTLQPYDSLELLPLPFSSPVVSSHVVSLLNKFSSKEFECFIPQIVFALKYCRDEKLLSVLIERSEEHISLRTSIYWVLSCYRKRDTTFTSYYNSYVLELDRRLGRSVVFDQLMAGRRLIKTLARMPSDRMGPEARREYLLRNSDKLRCSIRFSATDSIKQISNPIPLPLNPDCLIQAIEIHGLNTKQSITSPIVIPMICSYEGRPVLQSILYKKECLLQDMIIINIIRLMDIILKREEGIDFGIKTYSVLPLGSDSGIIEMIPDSYTLYTIKYQKKLTLLNYILENNEQLPTSAVRDRFIKSAAAYCVISYLLGVGDRHLDNIMITKDGYLFHIDYGYILGNDPKPLQPAMRITQDIVDAMGGPSSSRFDQFKTYCSRIYNCLRKHTYLFMSMLLLLTEDGLALDPKRYSKIRLREEILTRFVPSESSLDAETQLLIKIEESYQSYTPRMFVDFWHYHSRETLSKFWLTS